jgi:hypothetical protein
MKVMVIVKATRESVAGVMPSHELLAAMGRFNEDPRRPQRASPSSGRHVGQPDRLLADPVARRRGGRRPRAG